MKVKHVSHKLSLNDYHGYFEKLRINHGKLFWLVYFSGCSAHLGHGAQVWPSQT